MNIIIPLNKGSRFNDKELMYCIRGIEMFLSNVEQIFIIGYLPPFLKNVTLIKADDRNGKENNIYNKVRSYFKQHGGKAIFFNDDHFITKPIDAENYPYYYCRTLKENMMNHRGNTYYYSILNTIQALRKKPQRNFDVHCPIIYEAEKFLQLDKLYPRLDAGYILKSLYCNTFGIEGEEMNDLKFLDKLSFAGYQDAIKARHIFSMDNRTACSEYWKFMDSLYPNKSKYEI